MHFEQLRAAWQRHVEESPGRIDPALLAGLVEQFAVEFERTIVRRDRRETVAALVVIVLFGLSALGIPAIVGKIGCLIVVAGAAAIIGMLWRARRAGMRPSPALPLAEFLAAERDNLVRQIRLLRGVAWWYLSPIVIGANLVFWSMSSTRTAAVCYLVGTLLFGLFVWWLNQRAVRAHLQPLVDEIDRLGKLLAAEDPGVGGELEPS
jgi:hypothetical protein